MPIVIICDDTISMIVKTYNKESVIEVAFKFVQQLFSTIVSPYLHYVALYQRTETENNLIFRKSSKIIVEQSKEIVKQCYSNLRGDFPFQEAVKFCDEELTRTWGSDSPNIIIILTDGGKRSQFYCEDAADRGAALDGGFRSIVHAVSFTDHMSESIRSLSEQTGGACICAKPEWRDALSGDEVVEKLLLTFRRSAIHIYQSDATVNLGHFRMNVKLFPFVDLNYSNDSLYCFDNSRIDEMANISVDIFGFLSLADLNYPCSLSDHAVILNQTLLTSTEQPECDDATIQSSLYFAALLNSGLSSTKTAAICSLRYSSSTSGTGNTNGGSDSMRYGFLRNFSIGENKYSLKLCIFPKSYNGLSWVGRFTHLNPCSDFPEIYGNVDSKSPFPIKIRGDCSYKVNTEDSYQYTTWISAQSSVVNDFSKIIRICKRLPERKQIFYKEINRLRETALAIGSKGLLSQLCFMLQRESANITNTDAQAVIRYVVENLTNNPHEVLADKK